MFLKNHLYYLFLIWLKGCSSFFLGRVMPSDFSPSTASFMVSSLTQTRILTVTFLQPATVLLSLVSSQQWWSYRKISSDFCHIYLCLWMFYWITKFWMKLLCVFSARTCIVFIVCILTTCFPLISPLSSWSYNYFSFCPSLFLEKCSPVSWAVLLSLNPSFHIPLFIFPQEPLLLLSIFFFADVKNCFIRNTLLPW